MAGDGLKDWIEAVFAPLGNVRTRKMFGGCGVAIDGINMAFFGDGEVYLKVDALRKARFVEAGLEPLTYDMKGKAFEMSYYQAPSDFYDDSDTALEWGRLALDAARRSAVKKPAKTRKAKS
jgi:DNA transformation protein and related proteins